MCVCVCVREIDRNKKLREKNLLLYYKTFANLQLYNYSSIYNYKKHESEPKQIPLIFQENFYQLLYESIFWNRLRASKAMWCVYRSLLQSFMANFRFCTRQAHLKLFHLHLFFFQHFGFFFSRRKLLLY